MPRKGDKAPSSRMAFYLWYPGDYLSDERVELMSLEAEACYRRLLDRAWRRAASTGDLGLPDDDAVLASYCRTTPEKFRAEIRPQLLDSEHTRVFQLQDGKWINNRLMREYEAAQGKIEKAREAVSHRRDRQHGAGAGGGRDAEVGAGSEDGAAPGTQGTLVPAPTAPPAKRPKAAAAAPQETWLTPYAELWEAEIGGSFPGASFAGQITRAHRDAERRGKSIDLLMALGNYLRNHRGAQARFISIPKFASAWPQWIDPQPHLLRGVGAGSAAADRTAALNRDLLADAAAEDAAGGVSALRVVR